MLQQSREDPSMDGKNSTKTSGGAGRGNVRLLLTPRTGVGQSEAGELGAGAC